VKSVYSKSLGTNDGASVSDEDGWVDVKAVGGVVGSPTTKLGINVDGLTVGFVEGSRDTASVGRFVGASDGLKVVNEAVGSSVGAKDGCEVGFPVVVAMGAKFGVSIGMLDGSVVGNDDGFDDGL
jgi:hypothetical protein